jgi:TolA-binding protein
MNREMTQKLSIIFIVASLVSSCSMFAGRDVIGGSKSAKKEQPQSVSKKQYDELLEKYQALLRRNRQLEGEDLPNDMISTAKQSKKELPKLAETVDVFAKQLDKQVEAQAAPKKSTVAASVRPQVIVPQQQFSNKNVSGQIAQLKEAIQLISQNRLDQALQSLKTLEDSKYRQIQVRVKFYMGEILFKQGEFDLAMQIFEEVINRHAFSGIVLKTLGRLIICSEKLKVKKKYDLYYSILHDFFQTA